jgi:DNA helicase IV
LRIPPAAYDPSVGELQDEQRHLDATVEANERAFKALVSRRTLIDDEYAAEALERMRRERIRVYNEASGPLYFGRIDGAGVGTLYIGRHAIWGPANDLLAVNWRAPAAEPFYTATERDPHGLERRRRLDIQDRQVLGFVDEPLVPGGEDHLTEAIVEDITRQRVGEMRQIISTITPDQYELISRDVEGALVIQGGPGTGKTAVGLHRAAWLLYANPDLARAGVLVVGPNETFIRYIEQVLPALGEGGVEQRPIGALISRPHGEVDETRELAALKGSARIATILHRLLWDRMSFEPAEIPVGRRTIAVSEEDLRELVASVRERTFSYEAGRERFRERLAGTIASRALHAKSLAGQEEAISAVRKTREYQRLVSRAWPRETPEGLVEKLFKNRARLARVAGDLLAEDEIALLLKSSAAVKRRDMTPTDVALLDEAHWLIDPGFRRFGHVVVDEAQNLTPMELRMTVRRARRQSLTILGDLAQRTAEAGVSSWENVLREAGVGAHVVSELAVSYRVPNDFLALAGTLLPPGAPAPVGVREAPYPLVVVAAEDVGPAVAREAIRLADEVGSVGVIAPHECLDAVAAGLAGSGFADAIHGALGPGINLLDLHVAKGLEFDAIVVVEPAAILAERPDGGVGGLHTALTRATRALAIVHNMPLPEALRTEIDRNAR